MKSSNLAVRLEPAGAESLDGGIPRLAREILARDARCAEAPPVTQVPTARRRPVGRAIVTRDQGLAPFRVR